MKFIATKKGFYGDTIILPGESFEAPSDLKASWATPEKAYKPEPEKSEEELADEAREGLQGAKKKTTKKASKKKVAAKKSKE